MMLHVTRVCVLLLLSGRGFLGGVSCEEECEGGGDGNNKGGDGISEGGEFWTVRTRGGAVRGRRAPEGYYSFFGIPYGAPPTGEHRFKPPRPAAPWSGVLVADTQRLCPQPPTSYSSTSLGAEDCLAVDVFAPAPAPAAPRAVYVHLHGGAYRFDTRPLTTLAVRYLLQHDIIVVSVSYRLGALGFLCLGTEEAPGNAALRDILLALRWVRDNIAAFGGGGRVTLAGRSVGSYAAHTLAVSPAAAGLFDNLLASDGTALIEKNLMNYPVSVARTYAKKLGFESDDVSELAKFYRESSVDKLLSQSSNFTNLDDGQLGFGVCVERPVRGVQRVVSRAPVLALAVNTRPVMFTICNDESSIKAADLIKKNRQYNEDFPSFSAANLDFPSDEVKYAVSNETRLFYFGNGTITAKSRVPFGNFWADRQYLYQAVFCASEYARHGVPVYLLEFTYEGGLNDKKPEPVAPGAGHPDFFNYLMPPKEVEDENDLRIVKEVTSIVAYFVKTGHARASVAFPAASPDLQRVAWLRVGSSGAEARIAALSPALALWHRIYSQYRRVDYWPLTEDGE